MKFIAWDTSSKQGVIVAAELVSDQLKLVSEWSLNIDLTHSERLLWGIHQVIQAARWTLDEVGFFGVGLGPGSFTGLRVGLTTARTLSHTLNKPLVGVSSLAVLARPAALHFSQKGWPYPTWIVAVTDACKGELFAYWGLASGMLKAEAAEQVVTPRFLIDNIKDRISRSPKAKWVTIGEGSRRYLEEWSRLPKLKELECPFAYPDQVQGRYLALLVWEAHQVNGGHPGLEVHPHYLRASDAELKLKASLQIKVTSK